MSDRKIRSTTDYTLFRRSDENRPTDLPRHKKLVESMKQYGFLWCLPIVCVREGGKLVIKDGQHRWEIASRLGLPVHYIESDVDFDIAVINCTSKCWVIRDYAEKYLLDGKDDYAVGLEFASRHKIPLGPAFALLAGTVSYGNVAPEFTSGAFRVKDLEWAEAVAEVHTAFVAINAELRKAQFLSACMGVCRVAGLDRRRLLCNARRSPERLKNYGTKEGFLTMLEEVYNFNQPAHRKLPLKIEVERAMKDRCAVKPKAKAKKAQPVGA